MLISSSIPKKNRKFKKVAKINAIIWFLLTAEAIIPTDAKVLPNRNKATYEPAVVAISIFPIGFPRFHNMYIYTPENNKITKRRNTTARYLANTIFHREIGRVKSNGSIPIRLSSEILRIVRAGIRKTKSQAERIKKGCKEANPLSIIL